MTTTSTQRDQTILTSDIRFATPGARESLLAWCAENGVGGDRVAKITVESGRVEFLVYLLDADGKPYVDETGRNAARKVVEVENATPLPEVWQ